jgi:aminoglycoside phosphotransferase (APT) family kinase protein
MSPAMFERMAGRSVLAAEPLADGYRNSNFLLRTEGEPLVLRIYRDGPDPCRKELDLYQLVWRSVPVPEPVRAEPGGDPPFLLLRYVEGITYRELRRGGDAAAIAQAARSAGETLASIGRFGFDRPGWLGPGLKVGPLLLEGPDPVPRFVQERIAVAPVSAELRERVTRLIWDHAADLRELDGEARLAHGDFNKRNLIVRCIGGTWRVVVVLDWEFAVSGSPLMDIGNFTRTAEEPSFVEGYLSAGGSLPSNWRQLARLVDLAATCALLAEPETPAAVADEVIAGIERTLAIF